VNIDYKLISDLFKMNGLNYNNLLITSIVLVRKVRRAGLKIGRGWKRGLKRFRGNRKLANFSEQGEGVNHPGRRSGLNCKRLGMPLPLLR